MIGKSKKTNKVLISHDELTVMIFAYRYGVERLTYAPCLVCDYIIANMPRMTSIQRDMVYQEVCQTLEYKWYADDIAKEAVEKHALQKAGGGYNQR